VKLIELKSNPDLSERVADHLAKVFKKNEKYFENLEFEFKEFEEMY